MKDDKHSLEDAKLRTLLLEARSAAQLPPRFQESVWRRIEIEEAPAIAKASSFGWLERWTERLLLPRVALASLALLLVVGGLTGFVSGADTARIQAQERYLSAVVPNTLR